MRLRSAIIAAALALVFSTKAQAQTKLLTYKGQWGDALESVLAQSPGLPVTVDRYDATLLGVATSGASLIDVETGAANHLCDEGPGQPLTPSFTEILPEGLMPAAAHQCGVGYLVTSLMLAAGMEGPEDWRAFFDTGTHPGARALPRGARGTLEIALLADGVEPGDVYSKLATPDGRAAALARLDGLFARTQIVFWDTPDDAVALLRAGAVAAAAMPSAHAAQIARDDTGAGGDTLQLSFDAQIYRLQRLVILPAATSDEETVHRVIERILSVEGQALLAETLLAGPVNPAVWPDIPAAFAPLLPTAPVHRIFETGLADDPDFWSLHGNALEREFAVWLEAHENAHQRVRGPASP